MKYKTLLQHTLCLGLGIGSLFGGTALAQQAALNHDDVSRKMDASVPRMVRFAGTLKDNAGSPRTGVTPVLFSVYAAQGGGVAIWEEIQNVKADDQGRYSVLLGSTHDDGIPSAIFTTNEARWLGVRAMADAEPEQARVLLVSVPYALKSQDADTLGGLPASAYMRADAFTRSADLSSKSPADVAAKSGSASAAGKTTAGAGLLGSTSHHGSTAEHMLAKFSAESPDGLDYSTISERQVAILDGNGIFVRNETRIGVGMEQSDPAAKLHINGDLKANGLTIDSTVAGGPTFNNALADGNGLQVYAQGSGYSYGVFAVSSSAEGAGVVGIVDNTADASADKQSYAVAGMNYNAYGTGIFGWSKYQASGSPLAVPTASTPAGLYAVADGSSSIAGILESRNAQANIFSGRFNGTEKIAMNTSGDLAASGVVSATGFTRTAGAANCPSNKVMSGLDGSMNPVCADSVTVSGLTIQSSQINGPTFNNSLTDGNGLQVFATGTGSSYGVFAVSESSQGAGVVGVASNASSAVQGESSHGVAGLSYNAYGSGLLGWSKYQLSGDLLAMPVADVPAGLFAVADGSTSIAGVFDARNASAKIFSGRFNGTEKISMTTSGNISATGTVAAQSFQRTSGATACSATTVVTGLDGNLNPVCTALAAGVVVGSASQVYVDNAIATSEAAVASARYLKRAFAQTSVQAGDTITDGGTFGTTYTLYASDLAVGSVVEIWASGKVSSTAIAENLQGYGVKIGNTVVVPATSVLFYESEVRWQLEARLICVAINGTTFTFEAQGFEKIGQKSEVLGNDATIDVTINGSAALSMYEASERTGHTSTMRQLIVKMAK